MADRNDWPSRLATALRLAHSPLAGIAPLPMADKGLAHRHLRLPGSGLLARLPKQSQMGLAAAANLAYEAACFERAAASGHAPRLAGVLAPSHALPRGALLVEEIVGRPARLPGELPALLQALARIHALPLPAAGQRAPLLDAAEPLRELMREVDAQALHLADKRVAAASRECVEAVRRGWRCEATLERRLIAFDAHPGNFIVRANGSAVLVDLEKARYSLPALDVAHATLYTSTTWDVDSHAVLGSEVLAQAYAGWAAELGDAAGSADTWLALRRAMWLWSIGWCAKWLASADRAAAPTADGEDWSAAHSDAVLVAHVRERVLHYLSPQTVQQVVDGFDELARRLRG